MRSGPPEPESVREGHREALIGNRLHFAPLAGIADAPVRILARLFGAGPLMTEMISTHGVACGRQSLLEEQLALLPLEAPLAVQLVGSDPGIVASVARMAEVLGAASINLNMACPARKIVKGLKGCAMMRRPDQAAAVMTAVKDAVSLPVTVKIRAGWNRANINAVEFSRLAEDAGMDAIFIHPRTREQGFGGRADWSLITRVRDAVTIPVVGNGDIRSPEDALRMLRTTGCDAVMVGRAALGQPWLFTRIGRAMAGEGLGGEPPPPPRVDAYGPTDFCVDRLEAGDSAQVNRLVRLQVALASLIKPESLVARQVRKHLIWYSRGMENSAAFRARIYTAVDLPTLLELVDDFFS